MINQRTIKNNVKSSASKTKIRNLRQLNDRDKKKKEILKKREKIELYVPP